MSAVLAMVEDTRLYSRPTRSPVDVVAPQHQDIHADLERWGAWNRIRYRAGTCGSVEKNFNTRGGDRSHHYPVMPIALPVNPRNRLIDRAVLWMPLQHRETVKLFYVERREPKVICRAVAIHWTDFGRWMFDCRAMIINLLREIGA